MSQSESLAEQVARLPKAEQDAILADMDMETLQWDWRFWGRSAQFAPEGGWDVWLIVAGRGFGKTRAGAEWVREQALANPGCRIGLVGRTTSDVQRVMLYGDSGIMNIGPEDERPEHKISKGRLEWKNGSIAETFSAEEPDQLRGPQFDFAWSDETAAWKFIVDASGLNAWGNLRLGTRLGSHPRILATTTPKRTQFMTEMLDEASEREGSVVITRGSTYDNKGNLSQAYLDAITGVYAGTALSQQELFGEMLDDADGALWTPEIIDSSRFLGSTAPGLPLRVVAVDPSVAENPRDECGIVVVGATAQRHMYQRHAWVLEDASVLGSPAVWTRRVVEMARKWNAPVVAEVNQGGALVADQITNLDPGIRVYTVSAMVAKKLRAEPVTMAYQQRRVHHYGYLSELEGQMTTWDPEVSKKSPDRLDALVHGLTALLIKPPKGMHAGGIRTSSVAGRSIAGIKSKGRGRT